MVHLSHCIALFHLDSVSSNLHKRLSPHKIIRGRHENKQKPTEHKKNVINELHRENMLDTAMIIQLTVQTK